MLRCRVIQARRGRCRDVYLTLRCDDGQQHVVKLRGFKPYFYYRSEFGSYRSIYGERLEKYEVECPEDVRERRALYQVHYEADIPYARRILIDLGIRAGIEYTGGFEADPVQVRPIDERLPEPVVSYFDIEVMAGELPSPGRPEHPIIAVTFHHRGRHVTFAWHKSFRQKRLRGLKIIRACGREAERVEWEVNLFDTEESMLLSLLTWLTSDPPDYLVAWNVGFDYHYLIERSRVYGIDLNMTPVPFDLREGYRELGPKQRSYRLKEVTVAEGLECREDAVEAVDVMRGWEDNPKELLLYNLRDVWRIVNIDRIHRITEYYIALRDITGIESISKRYNEWDIGTVSSLPLIDTLLLRKAKERGIVLPSSIDNRKRDIVRGALVLEPVPGVHEGVAVLDMSRYYPSLIISFNISPETKLGPIDRAEGIWAFRDEPEGLLPETVRIILEMREKLEEELSRHDPGSREYRDLENKIMALKGLANSFYGVTANPHFRLFDPDVANTITGLAREGISFVARRAESMGYRILYGDTDSLVVKVPFDTAQELADRLTEELREYFETKYNKKRKMIVKLKFEKYYSKIFFKPKTKKRYAGLLVWKKGKRIEPQQLDIVGFEAVRTDAAPFTAKAQERIFRIILERGEREPVIRELAKLEQEAKSLTLSEIALYTGLQKNPEEYSVKQPHVRAAIYSNMYLGTRFTAGSRIRYIYVRRSLCSKYPQTDVVAFDSDTEEEVSRCFEVDWQKQLESILYGPVNEILASVGIKYTPGVRLHSFF